MSLLISMKFYHGVRCFSVGFVYLIGTVSPVSLCFFIASSRVFVPSGLSLCVFVVKSNFPSNTSPFILRTILRRIKTRQQYCH